MSGKSRVRSTAGQIKMLTDYMSTHPALAHGEFSGAQGRLREQRSWEDLKELLNEHGPKKTVDQWRVTWRDLRRKARTEGSAANRASTSTGNNTVVPVLSDNTAKILGIMGTEAAYGISGGEESGIGSSEPVVPDPLEEVLEVYDIFEEVAQENEVVVQSEPLAAPPLLTPANQEPRPSLAPAATTVRRPTRRNIVQRQRLARSSDFLHAEQEGNNILKNIAYHLAVANQLSALRSRLAFKERLWGFRRNLFK